MSPAWRVLGFLAACLTIFAVAIGVGRLVGPLATEPEVGDHGMGGDQMAGMTGNAAAGHDVGGLEATADGYTLVADQPQLAPGRQLLTFTIVGPDGEPVTAYDEQHKRDLHLIVVRRDLTGFQHVHPALDPSTGEWQVRVDLTPGAWRVLADFVPAGAEQLVLGTDLLVPGDFVPEPLGEDRTVAEGDGYDVTIVGSLAGGHDTMLTATVSRDGAPVADLQPYLGAYGHLVTLRDGDLGYLHVHPDEAALPGPDVAFHTEFPSAGRYRLFLDFRHGGKVHTAAFTVTVEGGHDH
jgi:hypothetical protein